LTRLLGRAGAGGDEDAVERGAVGVVEAPLGVGLGHGVVAHDDGLRAELVEVPDDRVDERVVVVHDEDAGLVGHRGASPDTAPAASVWMLGSLNGMYSETSGNSHSKHASTTAAARTSRRRARTHAGPGSARHSAPYITRSLRPAVRSARRGPAACRPRPASSS